MIIVNQEPLSQEILNNQFKKFSKININYDDIHTIIYYEKIPKLKDILMLINLKKIYIFSSEIMRYRQIIPSKLSTFLNNINGLTNLNFLSVIGYPLQNESKKIVCFDNLPYNLNNLEFSIFKYDNLNLLNLPLGLKNIKIDLYCEIDYDKINKYFNIKYPYGCELDLYPNFLQYYKYLNSFAISSIYH